MGLFSQCIIETLCFQFLALAYPASLYFLYDKGYFLNFYLTIAIIFFYFIYLCSYYNSKLKTDKFENRKSCLFPIKQYSIYYCIIGILVQINLLFLETFTVNENNEIEIDWILSGLKLCMTIETLKRVYFQVYGYKLIVAVLCLEAVEPGYMEEWLSLTFNIIWENFYSHYNKGCELGACSVIFAIIVSMVHGALEMLSTYSIGVQIAFGVINLVYLTMKFYTICWICKIKAQLSNRY